MRAAMSAIVARLDSSAMSVDATQASSKSASATTIAPPASTASRALRRCSPLPAAYGTNTAGIPSAVSSATVDGASATEGQVGDGERELHAIAVLEHEYPSRPGSATSSRNSPVR